VRELWDPFHALAQQVIAGGKVDVAQVADLNQPLLKHMNTAVRLYEKAATESTGKSAGVVINLAGKQRMLSQEMSKEILLVALAHDADNNRSNVRNTASLFERTLKGLKDGDADLQLPPTTDAAIRAQLDKVEALWQQFKPLVDRAGAVNSAPLSPEELAQLARLNLPLLKEMDHAVTLYEKAEQ
ncbi:MAG: type IV pili methyl-accepting chemotaxis transducer N-terminal domain-containing protein, partial [Propionivibrio sp.]